MRRLLPLTALSVVALGALASAQAQSPQTQSAQVQTVNRAITVQSGKNVQLAVYLNVQPDCTSGPLPAIMLATPPAHGNITVKRAVVTATSYKKCLALQVPAFVAIYRSLPDFTGVDAIALQVKYPGGRTELQRIKITVAGAGPPEKRI